MCLFMLVEVHLLATANDKITRRLHCPLSKEARAAMHYMCAAHVGDKKMGKYSSAVLFCNPVWGEGHLHEQGLASFYIWGCTIAASQLSVLFLENNPANCRHRFSQLTAGRWIWLGMQKKTSQDKKTKGNYVTGALPLGWGCCEFSKLSPMTDGWTDGQAIS